MSDGSAAREFHERMDALFSALAPRDSREYLEHLRVAPVDALPPQVLVRAYREAAAKGWDEVRERTFERLVRERNGRFDHLGPLVRRLRNMVPPNQNWQDSRDLLQDTIAEMLRVLPTDRGELGERSWFHFALRCARDAWRGKDRQGRRGEHIEPPRQEPEWNGDGWTNPVEEALAADSPSNELDPDVYTLLAEVIAGITDPLIRKVGEDLWLSGDPSPVTGKQKSAGGKPALVTQLGESRDKLVRAEGVVLARILAELERRGIARERLDPYRKKPR